MLLFLSLLLSFTGSSFSTHSVLQESTSFPHASHTHWSNSFTSRTIFTPWRSWPVALKLSRSDFPPKYLTYWISPLGCSMDLKEHIFCLPSSPQSFLLHLPSSWGMTSLLLYLPKPDTWASSLGISSSLSYSPRREQLTFTPHAVMFITTSNLDAAARPSPLCSCGTLWFPHSLISSLVSAFCSEWLFLNVNLSMLSLHSKFASGSISQNKVHHPHFGM